MLLQSLADAYTGRRLDTSQFPFNNTDRPLVIAHRGGMGCWPENTAFAFQHAADLGADCLEMDIHRTADGHLVVSHDPDLDRATDGQGAITNLTLDEIQSCDAGARWTGDDGKTFPFTGQDIRVPTLAEVFERFGHLRMIIDCKPPNPEIALQLARQAQDQGVADKVCLASFHRPNVLAIREAFPHIATSCSEPEVQVFWAVQLLRLSAPYRNSAVALQVPPDQYGVPFLTRHFIRTAHRHGMRLHVWTINDIGEMRRLLDLGADGIITDHPERLVQLLKP